MDSWIAQMCRGRARRQTLAWAVVLLAGTAFVFSNARYVRNFFKGPFVLQPNELAQVTDLEATPDYFVSVTGVKVIDTEIQEVARHSGPGTADVYPIYWRIALEAGLETVGVETFRCFDLQAILGASARSETSDVGLPFPLN